jgi:hypothetical protein
MSTAPSSSRNPVRFVVAGLAAAVIVALLWWLMSPTEVNTTPSGRDVAEMRAKRKAAKGKVRAVPATAAKPTEWLPLEEDPAIPVVTATCKWIVTDERRNVPQWVMLDNLRDRGQLFVEDDIRCLSAAGVTPAILDFAERYIDRNKQQGIVGRPPGQ